MDPPSSASTTHLALAVDDVAPWQGFAAAAVAVLSHVGAVFNLDLWFVTRVDGEDQVVVAAWANGMPLPAGEVFPWADSLCVRMVSGRAPRVAPRVRAVPAYAETPVVAEGPVQAYLGVPVLSDDGALFGTLCGFGFRSHDESLYGALPLAELLARLLGTVLNKEAAAWERSVDAADAFARAERDPLTGMLNRRGWERRLEVEEERCRRYGSPATVLALELDDYLPLVPSARATTRFGAPGTGTGNGPGTASGGPDVDVGLAAEDPDAADARLRLAAQVLADASRPADVVTRVGGAEFALLAVECTTADARAVRVRLEHDLRAAGLSATIGVSTRVLGADLRETYGLARERMLAAQRGVSSLLVPGRSMGGRRHTVVSIESASSLRDRPNAYDSLTGLPQRAMFQDRLQHTLGRAALTDELVAVVLVAADIVGGVHGPYGHAAGNHVLVELAKRLTGAVRPVETVARFGPQEFGILLEPVSGAEQLSPVADRIGQRAREPFMVSGERVGLVTAIGVAVGRGTSCSAEEILGAADAALYGSRHRASSWSMAMPSRRPKVWMLQFACGDVVPGCDAKFSFQTEDEIMVALTEHVRHVHGFTTLTAELAERVRQAVRSPA